MATLTESADEVDDECSQKEGVFGPFAACPYCFGHRYRTIIATKLENSYYASFDWLAA